MKNDSSDSDRLSAPNSSMAINKLRTIDVVENNSSEEESFPSSLLPSLVAAALSIFVDADLIMSPSISSILESDLPLPRRRVVGGQVSHSVARTTVAAIVISL